MVTLIVNMPGTIVEAGTLHIVLRSSARDLAIMIAILHLEHGP